MITTAHAAAIVTASTALVLAPIDPQPIRDALTTPKPAPTPEPAFDQALIARVRTALGLSAGQPRREIGETETRLCLWSQLELNDLYERTGGTVTETGQEITLTIDVPGIGTVTAVTEWCDDLAKYGARDTLPLMRALDRPEPEILETVPADGSLLGHTRYAIAPGAPLPDGRTIATVEDPRGSAWRVTDGQGTVHHLHKHGLLLRYTNGEVSFIEPEWIRRL